MSGRPSSTDQPGFIFVRQWNKDISRFIRSRLMVFNLRRLGFLSLALFLTCGAITLQSLTQTNLRSVTFAEREDAYRANNLGVALLEQYDYKTAAEHFRRALSLDPGLTIAHINLAIALFNLQDLDASQREAQIASESDPALPQPIYLLGMIARSQNRFDDAIAAFRGVLKIDPNDVGSSVNLGQIYTQQQRYEEAIKLFRTAVDAEPYNSSALYNLATALIRTGQRNEGQALMAKFQSLRQSGAATNLGQNYLEQGHYAEALTSTGAEPELVDTSRPNVTFRPANIGQPTTTRKPTRKNFDTATALIDIDGDGDLDLVQGGPARLFRNDRGRFLDITRRSGDFAKAGSQSCFSMIAGDFDNDGKADLFVSWADRLALYRNLGGGRFRDITQTAKIPAIRSAARTSAFADVDHDGDLDIVISGFQSSSTILLRNNGDGTFTDISKSANVDLGIVAAAIIPTDYDNRRDIDLLMLPRQGAPVLLRNLRNGSFENVAAAVGLDKEKDLISAAVGDFNKDTFVDFFFGRAGRPGIFAVSDGRGRFIYKDAPAATANAGSALFLDYDNDGLLDLVANTTKGLVILRNLGDHWSDRPQYSTNLDLSGSKQILAADIDSDGDMDMLLSAKNGALQFLRNDGGNSNNSEFVRLKGRVSNKTGIGAKIDMRAGSLTQKLETYSASPMPAPADVHFGIGKRTKPDAVRIIWPSGVIQAEIDFPDIAKNTPAARRLNIEELDRKPSSCPYLYTWNGEKFEFITDFMGGGEMGAWGGPGVYHDPDPDEYVRIPPGKLRPKNGTYEVRVTNELEEVLFIDHLKLIAIEHDANTEVYPNEGLGIPTAGKNILYTTRGEHAPVSAIDANGRNVLPKIAQLDRNFYASFKSTNIRGYAEPHALTLKLDNKKGYNGRTLLLLTGWTDYAFSSDNLAASQSGRSLFFPRLEVKNRKGQWQTVIDPIGIAVGRPQTVVVDLTGKFLSDSREVRIVTNVKTYWDKIAVDTSEQTEVKTIEIRPARAELRERGYSEENNFDGMIVPDYQNAVFDARWKYFSGMFTRTGDVRPLLDQIDDVFVISKTGDEIALKFEALPDPPAGRKYTFLLYADGYSKEMDINSGSPDAVMPLPFKAMSRYPYGTDERFPMTAEKQRIYETYTTRSARAIIPRLETVLVNVR